MKPKTTAQVMREYTASKPKPKVRLSNVLTRENRRLMRKVYLMTRRHGYRVGMMTEEQRQLMYSLTSFLHWPAATKVIRAWDARRPVHQGIVVRGA